MMKINYQNMMEEELNIIKVLPEKPSLLLHTCCAPCSSYIIELLRDYFDITLYFYNPNIYPKEEHDRRLNELRLFVERFDSNKDIKLIAEEYTPIEFASCVTGLEEEREGGSRCFKCYDLRLSKTAVRASEENFDYFCTTLSISPHKNAEKINEIGKELANIYEVKFLFSNFKKKNGFKRSLELSKDFDLYRQEYCGCQYSMRDSLPE
ncbi:MAG: epoxyqueuosine reductase QueH [Candidatus Delongbacteria bacterium]|jgi:predicted adenine nucleotide alpha hydrolase (AANH) superfamily ATPase|nr:epoxyqueuosine reductase QueH [Candidatus Delongbacteria bacterium]